MDKNLLLYFLGPHEELFAQKIFLGNVVLFFFTIHEADESNAYDQRLAKVEKERKKISLQRREEARRSKT